MGTEIEEPTEEDRQAMLYMIDQATENLAYPDVKEFVKEALQTYGCWNQLMSAIQVENVLIDMMEKQKLIVPGSVTTLVEVMKAAALLHNLFYTDDYFWPDLFTARIELKPLADKYTIAEEIQNAVFQTIEAQLGQDMPVPLCRPTPATPTELFAWAVWFVKEYISDEEEQ